MKPTKLTWEEVSQFEEMPGYGQTIWQEQGNYFLVRSVGGVAEQRLVYNLSPELFQLLEAGQKNLSDVSFYIENDRWPPLL